MKNVLVVEDDLLIADLLQAALEAEGYSVSGVARTVGEAKEAAEQLSPDFAVIDIRLANGDLGTEVGAYLRRTTNAGIVFSTGNSYDVGLSNTHGDAVMAKPYRLRDIARALKIVDEIGHLGRTDLAFPRNFRLLEPAAAEVAQQPECDHHPALS